jgi:hypothetical protein
MSNRWIAVIVVAGCASNTPSSSFSAAQVTVDQGKMMNALSTDEQTQLCGELTESLSTNFGPREIACDFGSHSGTREGKPTCDGWYQTCLASTPETSTVPACTSNNSDMFECTITVGAYAACFNATNAYLLRAVESGPACSATDPGVVETADEMAACLNAACDYIWFD